MTEPLGKKIPITPEQGAAMGKHLFDVYESLRERNPTFYWKDMYEQERRKHYRLHHPGVDPNYYQDLADGWQPTDSLHPHAIGCIQEEE